MKKLLRFYTFMIFTFFCLERVWSDELRDIKPLLEAPQDRKWMWMAAVLMGCVLGAGFYLWFKFFKKSDVIKVSPKQKALDEISGLTLSAMKPEEVVFMLSKIIRFFFESQFGLKASEMTSSEFLNSFKNSSILNDHQKEALKSFLNQSDLIKFAKYQTNQQQIQELKQFSIDLIEQLDNQQQP